MTDPLDNNDDWADLAREFALDKPSAPAPADCEDRAEATEPLADDAAPEGAESEGAEEFDDAEDAPGGDGADGDAAPGTGRKRRRRRRRRRKGGAGDTAAPVAGAASEENGESGDESDETAEVVSSNDDYDASPGEEVEDFETEPAPLAAEEDTANDVLRELIATWNVPSWDSIVSGLYRPG
ncbi:hypothetical protein [Gemmata massiliana]|nr:hypothetical protein [Gemmata massiliana]